MAGGFLDRLKAGLGRTADAVANLLARPMDADAAMKLLAEEPRLEAAS